MHTVARVLAARSCGAIFHAPGFPLSTPAIKTMGIIGKDALFPNLDCGDSNECDDGTMPIRGDRGSGFNSLTTVPPITALNQPFSGTSAGVTTLLSNELTAGSNAAKGNDVAVVLVNAISGELGFYQSVDGNGGDRNDVVERQQPRDTIVVVHSVGLVHMWWTTHPNITAIVYAGTPGDQIGPALVDVLFGAVNPSGWLPFSITDIRFYILPPNIPVDLLSGFPIGFPTIEYTEKLLLDYRFMDAHNITSHYECGFGLSYTTFADSALSISSAGASQVVSQVVSFIVTNTRGRAPEVLRGFDEVPLAHQQVKMSVFQWEMSIWDTPSQSWVRPPGKVLVDVGASSRDIRLNATC
ncbi:glycoside hydrolase family 3 C-terminal domain-containing protein [Mycena vulgaris]|nr:glycoside hydrolase family 3 C-terminal domain-containing protein [Mycena vulgaris]